MLRAHRKGKKQEFKLRTPTQSRSSSCFIPDPEFEMKAEAKQCQGKVPQKGPSPETGQEIKTCSLLIDPGATYHSTHPRKTPEKPPKKQQSLSSLTEVVDTSGNNHVSIFLRL